MFPTPKSPSLSLGVHWGLNMSLAKTQAYSYSLMLGI